MLLLSGIKELDKAAVLHCDYVYTYRVSDSRVTIAFRQHSELPRLLFRNVCVFESLMVARFMFAYNV